MKVARVSPDTILVVCTFPLWAPALLLGMLVGVVVVGFMRGFRFIAGGGQ